MNTKITFYLIIIILGVSLNSLSQSTTNYTFSTAVDASLTDMSSGTTQLVAQNIDGLGQGIFSNVNDIGFTFYFMSLPYTTFVVTEDGVIRLGNSLSAIVRVPGTDIEYDDVTWKTLNEPRIVPFSCDMRTGSNGKVHYKITGTAPNRVLVIEWLNLQIPYPNPIINLGNSTFQVRLYETTGKIEFVYGYMYVATHRSPQEDFGAIGIGHGNTIDKILTKSGTFANSNVLNTVTSYCILPALITAAGEVNGLSSSTDGARRIYTFTPQVAPDAPTNLTFSGITQTTMTLNWIDNSSNESQFIIYRSDDGGLSYDIAGTAPANATSFGPINGLPDRTYLWRIFAVNEGACSIPLEGTCSTLPAGLINSTATGGPWSAAATWQGGVLPTLNDNVIIKDGATVIIDINGAVCNNLQVGEGLSGILRFIGGITNAQLTLDGDITVSTNGTFDVAVGATAGTRKIILGNRAYANGNLKVNGIFDMDCTGGAGTNSFAEVEFRGIVDGQISGTGATCDFYTININKGASIESILETTRIITLNAPTAAVAPYGNRLNVTNGTIKLSSSSSLTPYFGNQTICSITGRLWLNDNSASVQCVGTGTNSGAGNPTLNGSLKVSAGVFGYGSGNNTLTVNGTLELDGSNATVNMFGNVLFSNAAAPTSFFLMSAGALNIDPQAANNLAAANSCLFESNTFVNFTGGILTLVDPNANNITEFRIASSTSKTFSGSTIRFGNGASSTAGNATSTGFSMDIPNNSFRIGDVVVNNPAGANRNVSIVSADCYLENLNITAGTFRINGKNLRPWGNLTNNGVINANAANSAIRFEGTVPQNYLGTGTVTTATNLLFEINNITGVTLNNPITSQTLNMTSGILNTTNTNILTVLGNTAASVTVTAGSTSTYINGPLIRTVATGAGPFLFPVGKSVYNLFELITLTAAAPITLKVEAFDGDCGGTIAVPYELVTNRYWNANITAGTLTTTGVRVTESAPTTNLHIGNCATINGLYSDVWASQAGNTVSTPTTLNSLNYFCVSAPAFLSGIYELGTGKTFTSLTQNNATGFFNAVNKAGLKGNVVLKVTSDITEDGAISLNQWAEINGSGYTINVIPDATTLRIISGTVGGGGATPPMININGADRFKIDGVNYYLLFRNTRGAANQTGAVIQFTNSSSDCKIANSILESNSSTTTSGVIVIGSSGTNNNDSIVGNQIKNAISGTVGSPANGIYSNFASNTNLNVINNQIYNWTNNGILFTLVGDNSIVTGNHFYSSQTPNSNLTSINIGSGVGHLISDNFIGGQSTNCGGASWANSNNITFKGISVTSGVGIPVSIQGNTIQNINLSGGTSTFTGIEILSGPSNVGTSTGNLIGHTTTSNSIQLNGNTINSGIKNNSTSSVSIWNNTIANILNSAANTSNSFFGIWQSNTGSGNISKNTIFNISSASTKVSLSDLSLIGIYHSGASTGSSFITENSIYNLSLSNVGNVTTNVSGICVANVTSPIINKNVIYNITNASTRVVAATPPTANGIVVVNPAVNSIVEIRTNMISLGTGSNTNTEFNGIWLNSNANVYNASIYYNSISINGTVTGGALPSFGILRGNNNTVGSFGNITVAFKNNIFANRRNGGTGKHYAIGNQGNTPTVGWGAAATNYNFYVSANAGTIGLWNVTDCPISTLRTNSTGDVSSISAVSIAGTSDHSNINVANLFTDITNGDLHIKNNQPEAWFVHGRGTQMTLASDIDGDTRSIAVTSGSTEIGADEFNPTSTPIACNMTGTIGDGNNTVFSFANRIIADITWHGSNFPTAIQILNFTGKNPDLNDGFGTPYPGLVGNQYSNCVWTINPTGGNINNFTYDLNLNYDAAITGSIDDVTAIRIAKNPYIFPLVTSPIVNDYAPYGTVVNTVNKTAKISGIIGFSDFILFKGSIVSLPIELLDFNAIKNSNVIDINWATAAEINNDFFTIEKSSNGLEFETVTIVKGAGNSSNKIEYYTVDDNPYKGISYYRLKQTDYDGKFTFSKLVAVDFTETSNNLSFDIFPNPISQNESTNIRINQFQPETEVLVVVRNLLGQELYSKVLMTDFSGNSIIAVDVENRLPAGTYLIIGTSLNHTFNKYLVIK